MFKSSENLRLAAEMRALERVARPWREVRVSWFDGTPESIEARLAATERVLTYARAGVTPAHMALEREAATARAELKEASHRLMVDFLDDGARAFKGSKRVAIDYRDIAQNGGPIPAPSGDPLDSLIRSHELLNEPHAIDAIQDLAESGHHGAGAYLEKFYEKPEGYFTDPNYSGPAIPDRANNPFHEGSRRVAGDGDPMLDSYREPSPYDREEREFWRKHVKDTGPGIGDDDDDHFPSFGGFAAGGGLPSADTMRGEIDKYLGRESSYRVAKERGLRECINCEGALSGEEGDDKDAECLTCGMSAHEKGVDYRKSSVHTAAEDYSEGIDNLSRYLGDRLLNPEQFHRNYTNEDGQAGIPGGWPSELRKHLNDPYSAGYASSGHGPYLDHNDPMDAAGNDFYNAGGNGESSFNDGWLDYASDIPHKHNDPEGHAAYHADMNGH